MAPNLMIPYERCMGANFVPYDTIEWMEQQAAEEAAKRQSQDSHGLPVAERMAIAGLPQQPMPGTYLTHL